MTVAGLRLDALVRTDVGRVRDHNEDAYCERPQSGVWAVADGMGGHERGEWASATIAEALGQVPPQPDFDTLLQRAADAIHAANGRIFAEAEAKGAQMGSTVVALVVKDRRFGVLWAGDSRGYLLRGGFLHRLTRDHTQVQEMVDRGLLTPEAAEGHPMGHVLARAVGVRGTLELDAIADGVEPGDVFLLCSDGLTGVVEEPEIARMLDPSTARTAPDALVELVLERGAPDNVTVVMVSASEPTLLSFAAGETG
ncbi:PP2C family protein-serine/threonine phosphatase [Sphingomonas jatrophae]|uniref:Protein phosphatase/serine/threonine protein phosphatase Stp1 n=1 Tax=Sphingomonas jatrophae TaxID=1166337 RepID=A0A1I6LKN5_9SPHN|nr:protein phosphatase 2C domain-containing protein [Sphingomonas jatrophae]SFS03852.1 protein phosphatase/serine/threonine protein phosphatase Stp1 [Sphingomonas jatrophae]